MKKEYHFISCFILLAIAITVACRQSYEPAIIKANKNYLVVEGVINASPNSITTINLSRTNNVTDSVVYTPELNAQISILSKNGNISYPLHEQGNGVYASDDLTLNSSDEYQLQVITSQGSQYVSALVAVKQTPAIDSIHWTYTGDGVTLYANTHDPQNTTRYYRWDFTETWSYHPNLQTIYGVKDGLIYVRDATDQIDTCWQTDHSTGVLIGSSINLSQDIISNDSIARIPQNSIKIGDRYSILLRQYALTQESYQYWQLLQKNTQELGSIFDVQPSQLTGNIQCVTNISEPVIGYISVSTVEEKRVFIRNREVPGWQTAFSGADCLIKAIQVNPDNFAIYNYPDTSYAPYYFGQLEGLVIAKRSCLDCTLAGGTTNRPAFW